MYAILVCLRFIWAIDFPLFHAVFTDLLVIGCISHFPAQDRLTQQNPQ